jgi:hypothetical protein
MPLSLRDETGNFFGVSGNLSFVTGKFLVVTNIPVTTPKKLGDLRARNKRDAGNQNEMAN